MSRSSRTIDFPCPDTCRAYHPMSFVAETLRVGLRQAYRMTDDIRNRRLGVVRCDRLRKLAEPETCDESTEAS